jgi:hypothetical protein
MSDGYDCRHARLAIGGDPRHLPPEAEAHIAGCAACSNFLAETLGMDERLRKALELPLHRFRAAPAKPAAPGRLAMAASLLLAVMVAGGVWMFWPQPALAREVVEHVRHEPGSWMQSRPLPAEQLAAVLAKAGVKYDSRLPVVYASPCPFRGHVVPHFVVSTDRGPMTVMLLAHEKAPENAVYFDEDGYRGVILAADYGGAPGSIAVITRGTEFDGYLEQVIEGAR